MEKLVIETTAVESSSSTFTSISGQVDSLHGSVSGYDTSTSVSTSAPVSFDVDVSSLKDKIATNMQICAKRIKNISLAVEEVAKTHSSLQVSLETKAPHYLTESEDETGDSTSTTAGTYAASAGAGAAGAGAGAGSGSGSGSTTKKASDTKKDKKGPVETELTDVGYVYADTANLTKESLDLFSNANFEYDANGYAKIGDRYVVACDYTIGNIGDVIRFTQTTGEIIECVIGINTFSEKYKHTLNFIVNEASVPVTPTKVTESIIENNLAVDNIGPLSQAGSYKYVEKYDGVLPVDTKNTNTSV